ncbi:MAG: hypothetical protein AB7T07_15170 [Steroidobacteraceae bacterium]
MKRTDALGVTQSRVASGALTDAHWNQIPPEVATQEWELTAAEWARYLSLMQGRSRYFASEMPPPMVLAMYAKNEAERDRYAEVLARFERDKAERVLAVQRAYDAAMMRLYPQGKIIDLDILRDQGLMSPATVPGLSPDAGDKHKPRLGDRLVLFAAPGCEEKCARDIRTLATQYGIAPLEVYFTGESPALKTWVEKAGLQIEWLQKHGVTFARDEGQAQQYQASPGTTFIVRGEALYEMAVP